jgi:hypothetical protein
MSRFTIRKAKARIRPHPARPDAGGALVLLLLCALMLSAAAAGYYLMDDRQAWRIPAQTSHIALNFRR